MAHRVIHSLRELLAPGCLPLFTSDGLNVYFYALPGPFWTLDTGRSERAESPPVASSEGFDLWPGKKCYRRRKLVRVSHVMRLGTEEALKATLQGLGFSGRLNTAFIERVNLTVRHGIAALARRTWATAQQSPHLLAHLEWWRAYYHFVRPHQSLRVALVQPRERGGNDWHNAIASEPQRWPPAEPIDDGPRGKCSRAPCQRFPLERHRSQRGVAVSYCGEMVEGICTELGGSFTLGEADLPGLPHHQKSA